jgi:hypothetical protein
MRDTLTLDELKAAAEHWKVKINLNMNANR